MSRTNLWSKNVPRVELCTGLRLGRGLRSPSPAERSSHPPCESEGDRAAPATRPPPASAYDELKGSATPRSIAWM